MSRIRLIAPTAFAFLAATLSVAPACAQTAGPWQFQGTIYGYLPTISAKTNFPPSGGSSSDASIDADKILDNLKMVFMGSLDASNGQWGVFTDIVYVDIGNDKSNTQDFSLGRVGLPANTSANVEYDLKGWLWTLAGTYRMISDKDLKIDLLAGTRVLDIRQKLRWDLVGNVGQVSVVDNAGNRELSEQNWDFIVGFKGRAAMGDGGWFVPYYVDLGTGNSRFTWQAMVGVGYTFGWGDIIGAWRYIDYQMKSSQATEEMNFNGPAIAASFRW